MDPRDWKQIALLYERLEQITSSPVVTMNRAIALAEFEGPAHRIVIGPIFRTSSICLARLVSQCGSALAFGDIAAKALRSTTKALSLGTACECPMSAAGLRSIMDPRRFDREDQE